MGEGHDTGLNRTKVQEALLIFFSLQIFDGVPAENATHPFLVPQAHLLVGEEACVENISGSFTLNFTLPNTLVSTVTTVSMAYMLV